MPTLPNHPAYLSNFYYVASDKVLETEEGIKWSEAHEAWVTKFTISRSKELKRNGILSIVTSSASDIPDIKAHVLNEEAFY